MGSQEGAISINGQSLTIAEIARVARHRAPVSLPDSVKKAVRSSRDLLDRMVERREVIYGVNTGVGENVRFAIPPEKIEDLQQNILRSLSCGTGPLLPRDVVRGSVLLRANSLSKGFSAVRPLILERLVDLLNADIVPQVPRYGSLGASGDLIPSAYTGRVLLGQGEVWYAGREMQASEALRMASLSPIESLRSKEGLALVNGTSTMTSVAALSLDDAEYLAQLCVATAALSVESLHAARDPFEEPIHLVKNHPGQLEVARMVRKYTDGSTLASDLESMRTRLSGSAHADAGAVSKLEESIQDPYSLRCVPQGLGPIFDSLSFARQVIEREANSVNDNPLIDPELGRVYHTGNFYGGHVARVMDGLKLDLTVLANWLHSLMALLVDPRFSRGLPPSLAVEPGLNNGFKNMQLSLSSLTCACRQMAAPSSIHSLPTEQYNQDVVSLGMHSATTAMDIVDLLRSAVSITLIALCQAVDLRGYRRNGDIRLGGGTGHVYETVRGQVSFLEADRPMEEDIGRVNDLIQSRAFDLPGVTAQDVPIR